MIEQKVLAKVYEILDQSTKDHLDSRKRPLNIVTMHPTAAEGYIRIQEDVLLVVIQDIREMLREEVSN